MVVVALCIVVVDAANIADNVAGLEDVGITGADEGAVGVLGEETEEVDGQGLVGVEVATMGVSVLVHAVCAIGLGGVRLLVCSDLDGRHVDLLRGVLCGHGAVVMGGNGNGAQVGSAGVDGGL